uniref:Cysteine-rich with EGF-like domain protein 2 n=1 Tax=Panagrellus redivivus TaxID=6233 RepID=A0A7E5A1N7_PANRE
MLAPTGFGSSISLESCRDPKLAMPPSTGILIGALFLLAGTVAASSVAENACMQCKFLVETFKAGMKKTEKQHFAGGNTDWEERKLGKFATSETRFIEVLEHACKKESLADSKEFDAAKDLKFRCHTLVEEHEEVLEKWFFKKQTSDPDLFDYLCISDLKKCCATGHFGQACEPCPAVQKGLPVCFGRGSCDGNGYRSGTGKCKCEKGYVGHLCSNCDAYFYPIHQNDTAIECGECYDGCASGCTAAGPKGCRSCRSGYTMDGMLGCMDIDECVEGTKCLKDNEVCTNLVGSYRCDCAKGFRRNNNEECEVDIEAQKVINDTTASPETTSDTAPEAGDSEAAAEVHSDL